MQKICKRKAEGAAKQPLPLFYLLQVAGLPANGAAKGRADQQIKVGDSKEAKRNAGEGKVRMIVH